MVVCKGDFICLDGEGSLPRHLCVNEMKGEKGDGCKKSGRDVYCFS